MLVSMPNRIQGSKLDNHVFQFRGKPVVDIRTGLKKACEKAGIKYGRFAKGGFIFHDLRHYADSRIMPTPFVIFSHSDVIPVL
jgi:hypothetical protein